MMARPMVPILLGYGANVPGGWGTPRETIVRALHELPQRGVDILAASPLYETAPVGPVDQPSFINGAALAGTRLGPEALLAVLKALEREAGREAGLHWGPRALDIDILDYGGRILGWEGGAPVEPRGSMVLPHPELHRRAFVLVPLETIAPDWRHPVLGATPAAMLAALGGSEGVARLVD